jgi:hypothetical protein
MLEEMAPVHAGSWDASLLAPIAEINERMLERLRDAALADAANRPPLVAQLQSEWSALDVQAQRRLAHCPYLLLDAGFGDTRRWPYGGSPAVHESAAEPLPCGQGVGYLANPEWRALVRRTLVLGWHLARASPICARVLLGMSPGTAERIGATALSELDMLAEQGARWIAPRWEAQPAVWRQLLRASRATERELRLTQLRGLQLLAAVAAWPRQH